MKKKNDILKCSPKIYKKFSDNQKAVWNNLNGVFLEALKFLADMKKIPPLEVIAHNLTCEALWELERSGVIKS